MRFGSWWKRELTTGAACVAQASSRTVRQITILDAHGVEERGAMVVKLSTDGTDKLPCSHILHQ